METLLACFFINDTVQTISSYTFPFKMNPLVSQRQPESSHVCHLPLIILVGISFYPTTRPTLYPRLFFSGPVLIKVWDSTSSCSHYGSLSRKPSILVERGKSYPHCKEAFKATSPGLKTVCSLFFSPLSPICPDSMKQMLINS